MKLIIDIPSILYTQLKLNETAVRHFDNPYKTAILDGKPLPKDHGDLVDVSKVIHVSVFNEQYEEWEDREMTILDFVNTYTDEGITEAVIEADNVIRRPENEKDTDII